MAQGSVDVPEPFRSALAGHEPARVCDAEAATPEALYGRALAKIAVGREASARADLEAALPALGDNCGIELAFLDVRQRSAVDDAMVRARLILDRVEPGSRLRARTLHVLGLVEAKCRNTPAAIDDLLAAAAAYRALNDRLGLAHVRDTLGMVEGARGRLDSALQYYSLSLVDKSLLGDRYGMGVSLGNIGRLHLRSGRLLDAADCFQLDLDLARQIGDQRGTARMLEDLGRVNLAMDEWDRAESELAACITLAESCKFGDILFFAHKDLALVRVKQGRLDDAARELELAKETLPPNAEAYLPLVLAAARGELLLARADPQAIDVLRKTAEGFEQADLPDLYIPTLISLAKACLGQRMTLSAEDCLVRALRIARADGYGRYLPVLNEAMTSLDLVESIVHEEPRAIGDEQSSPPDGYVLREKLGSGGFGDTYRAFDSRRGQIVALKRLKLDELYDSAQRQRLLASARVELEAASRVRHPGIARVLAVGTDPQGGAFIVQEFINGRPLHERFAGTRNHLKWVLSILEKIAAALQALHDAGVVHRDLKPSNILLNEKDLPVLIDFGIAHIHSSTNMTEDVLGTLGYMAPEQAQGSKVDGRADLYALGAVAYKWLTGVLPIDPHGKSATQAVQDLVQLVPQPLSRFRSNLPRGVEGLVMRLLQKNRARRPSDADEVAETCRILAQGITDRGEEPDPKPAEAAATTATVKDDAGPTA